MSAALPPIDGFPGAALRAGGRPLSAEAIVAALDPPVADGTTLDDILSAMGARETFHGHDWHPERYETRPGMSFPTLKDGVGEPDVIRGEDGRPRLVDRIKNRFRFAENVNERDPEHFFRAVSEEDYQRMKREGFINSDGRMNIVSSEGLCASHSDPSFYLPGKLASDHLGEHVGRIIRIAYDPFDEWRVDGADGYIKTNAQVPFSRIDMVSPLLVTYCPNMTRPWLREVRVERDLRLEYDDARALRAREVRQEVGFEIGL